MTATVALTTMPRAYRRRAGALCLFATVALVGYWSHSKPAESAPIKAPERDTPHLDGNLIRFSAEFAERSRIAFSRAVMSRLAPTVNVTGTVTFDPQLMAAVGARVRGRIRRMYKLEGDTVRAGDILAEIESVEIGKAEAALLAARAQVGAADADERRELELAEARIASRREAELAVARAAAARADLLAAEERVRALCGTACDGTGILKLATPIAGKVIERNVSRGQSIEATQTAFRIADLGRLWVELAVFERQVGAIHRGDAVDLYPQSDPQQCLKGNVAYVSDIVDLETRTASVRVVVDHPRVQLRPGESVLAKVHTSAPPASSLVVPRAAVTRVDGRPTVFVGIDALSVEPRAVRLGGQDGDNVEIVGGLQDGDSVATAGVFALKSEIFR